MSESDEPPVTVAVDGALRGLFPWYPVAKKEFKDAIRSKGLWVLSLLFTALFVLPAAQIWWNLRDAEQPLAQQAQEFGMQFFISQFYLDTVTLLMSIVVFFVGYAAITSEKESGSLKVLLSLPFSRRDVIIGKVLGRAAVVAVPGAIAFLLTALFFALSPFTFKLSVFLLFAFFTLTLIVVITAIAVSISGAAPKNLYSLAGNVLVYLYLNFAWNSLANGIGRLLSNHLGASESARWHVVLFVKLFNPMQAFKTLTNSMLSERDNPEQVARFNMFSQDQETMATICDDVLSGDTATISPFGNQTNVSAEQVGFGAQTVCQDSAASLPLYFSDAAVFVYLLVWIGVAAAISYYTFDRVDL